MNLYMNYVWNTFESDSGKKKFTLKLYRFLFFFIGEVPRGKKKKLKDMAQKIAEGIPLSYRKCLRK